MSCEPLSEGFFAAYTSGVAVEALVEFRDALSPVLVLKFSWASPILNLNSSLVFLKTHPMKGFRPKKVNLSSAEMQ